MCGLSRQGAGQGSRGGQEGQGRAGAAAGPGQGRAGPGQEGRGLETKREGRD